VIVPAPELAPTRVMFALLGPREAAGRGLVADPRRRASSPRRSPRALGAGRAARGRRCTAGPSVEPPGRPGALPRSVNAASRRPVGAHGVRWLEVGWGGPKHPTPPNGAAEFTRGCPSATGMKFQDFLGNTPMRRNTDPALHYLRDLARPPRYRVTKDAEGFPIISGRYGRIEWFDGRDLAVYCDHPRLVAKVWTTRCGPSSRPRPSSRSQG
jgi:hypothetical protein